MAVCLQGRWRNPLGGSTWPCVCKGGSISRRVAFIHGSVCKGGGVTCRVAAHGRVSAREVA